VNTSPAPVATTAAVEFRDVDILFGDDPATALERLDAGATRAEVLETTGQVIGVAGASMAIAEGEICVLMGLSGSGKSTLLRAVNGLNQVTRGQVLVKDGDTTVDVAACDPATLRRLRSNRVAMVFQQFALLPWRTVRENVGLGLELRGMDKSEIGRVVDEKLELVHLDKWADKFAHELSGGMQQRVGLARAFATDAEILLMDEPFSALDPLIRTHLQEELLELQSALRKTIVFVSHDLDEALKIGRRIAIMEEGRIVQLGEPEQIVLDPANEYVADFVAHMNPLNVLRGGSLMRPVEDLARKDDRVVLDAQGYYEVALDAGGVPRSAWCDGRPVPLSHAAPEAPVDEQIVGLPVSVLMREAVETLHHTGSPVLLMEDDRMVGVIGQAEIYRGILRQSELGQS